MMHGDSAYVCNMYVCIYVSNTTGMQIFRVGVALLSLFAVEPRACTTSSVRWSRPAERREGYVRSNPEEQ